MLLGAALVHTFCGQQVRKELVLETVYDERKHEGSTELTTLFSACISTFLNITDRKKLLQNQDYLGRKFSKNCCIHVKSQKTSVLQSLKQLQTLLSFLILIYSIAFIHMIIKIWYLHLLNLDGHIHYLGLSYGVVSFIVKLLCCQNGIDRKCHWKHQFPVWMEWFYKKYRCQLLKMEP